MVFTAGGRGGGEGKDCLSCVVGGTADISIFVLLLGLIRFPRKEEETV